jgi:hypothetical protein
VVSLGQDYAIREDEPTREDIEVSGKEGSDSVLVVPSNNGLDVMLGLVK